MKIVGIGIISGIIDWMEADLREAFLHSRVHSFFLSSSRQLISKRSVLIHIINYTLLSVIVNLYCCWSLKHYKGVYIFLRSRSDAFLNTVGTGNWYTDIVLVPVLPGISVRVCLKFKSFSLI